MGERNAEAEGGCGRAAANPQGDLADQRQALVAAPGRQVHVLSHQDSTLLR
jgi:hypothetical protein